jgi:hypothetical protein
MVSRVTNHRAASNVLPSSVRGRPWMTSLIT